MSTIFVKTEKGSLEISSRVIGLSPRLRQLLILVDGKRTADALVDMLPAMEVKAHLTEFEALGLIAPIASTSAAIPNSDFGQLASGNSSVVMDRAEEHAVDALVPVLTQADSPAIAPSTRVISDPRAEIMRVSRLITETMGPNADSFAMRVEKCKNMQELRELIPQAMSLVEAVGGSRMLATFTRKLGPL